MELTPFLKSLLSTSGLSGYESPTAKLIEEAWKPLVDEIQYSKIGSLEALKKGTSTALSTGTSTALSKATSTASGSAPLRVNPKIMLAAHMDAIGMMVTQNRDGFLRVTQVGGVDARVLPGTPVIVHATGGGKTEELPGIVVQPPARLLPASLADAPVPMDYLFIETGLLPKDVAVKVQIGDLVSYATQAVELAGEALAGHTLDNRASVAVVTVALDELKKKSHAWDVWAVATVQEEVGLIGAFTSAEGLRPDLAVAIDVTFAKGPGTNDWQTFPFGKGPTLGFGPNLHPFLFKKFEELAKELEIPYQTEVIPRHSGTDAYATQISAEGIPSMVIGIPLRYMHTPVEVVALKDIQRAGRLLAEFIAALEPDFVEKIVWED